SITCRGPGRPLQTSSRTLNSRDLVKERFDIQRLSTVLGNGHRLQLGRTASGASDRAQLAPRAFEDRLGENDSALIVVLLPGNPAPFTGDEGHKGLPRLAGEDARIGIFHDPTLHDPEQQAAIFAIERHLITGLELFQALKYIS